MRNAVARVRALVCGQILLLSGAGIAYATTPLYTLTDLGELPGSADSSTAYGINNYGQVAGSSLTSGGPRAGVGTRHATLWTPDRPNGTTGTLMDLGVFRSGAGATIVDDYSEATGINDFGQVVGYSGPTGFLWTPASPNGVAGNMTDIGNLGGFATEPKAINNRGQIVGMSHKPGWIESAFLWSPDQERGTTGRMTDFGLVSKSSDRSIAVDVNESGAVLGWRHHHHERGKGSSLWTPEERNGMTGRMRELVIHDVDAFYPVPGVAQGMNDDGLVTGAFQGTVSRAFRMAPDGTVNLAASVWPEGTPAWQREAGFELATIGMDVNASGVVVGAIVPNYAERAFVWTSGSNSLADLNGLLDGTGVDWVLESANGINDLGQIVGDGLFDPDGDSATDNSVPRAFLLTPLSLLEQSAAVPEPGALWLLALGVASCSRRRRDRAVRTHARRVPITGGN